MNERLISWIKEIHPDPSEEYINKRESGIKLWIENYDKKDCIFLIASIFYNEKIDSVSLVKFTDAIKKHDELFIPNDSKREIQILSAVAFSILLDYDDNDSIILAISYIAASFGKKLNIIPQQNLLDISKDYLYQHSITQNISVNENTIIVSNKTAITKLKTELKENPSLPASNFLEIIIKMIDNSSSSIKSSNDVIEKLKASNLKLAEEVDILWWAFSGVSSVFSKSYADMTKYEACLLIGYELSKIIKIEPGPASINSILEKQISYCKDVNNKEDKFIKSITNLDDKFIEITINRLSKVKNLEMLLPIHVAIQRYEYAGRTGDWFTAFCRALEIKIDKDISLAIIAKHFNYECQLIDLF